MNASQQNGGGKDATQRDALLRAIFENSRDGILLAEVKTMRLSNANPAMCKMLGYAAEDIEHLELSDIHPPEAFESIRKDFERQARGEIEVAHDMPLIRKDGTVFYADINSTPFSLAGVVYMLGLFRDVTEMKEAKALLEAKDALLTDMSRMASIGGWEFDAETLKGTWTEEVAHIGSWHLDVSRDVLTWSDETHRIFGVKPGTSLTYEDFLAAIHPEDRAYVDAKWKAAMEGAPYDIEHRIIVNGEVKWVNERAELELNDKKELIGGIGTVQDITRQREAQETLLHTKQFTEAALDAQMDTFFLFDPATGKALRWNRTFRDVSGYTDAEIDAMPAPDSYYSPEDLERARATIPEILKAGRGTIEMELICKDGRRIPTEYRVSAVNDDHVPHLYRPRRYRSQTNGE
ncbi:MAG: PAS domain S-box protein [Verrucomicrobia bacterium]|nr:PAS domain S-box protein [Verrucomicrobiota bacterium]